MIRTVNLTKIFRADEIETTALENINFEVVRSHGFCIHSPGRAKFLSVLYSVNCCTGKGFVFRYLGGIRCPWP